ncbi:DUF2897 family protein [Shewanella psychropiezotolerans]|uniref:DUF2897 family protein n=1 Tax=Shewanella psychropiezotolerans TaxID=2593655 RepID=A0ABX5WXV6_9GAMM|nr:MULTISPECIES: DUF2897 family protein [Shewanella]MPY24696.1 DUF2897 family protein [Shewanella sp. YLB-07]QDO83899.1 DUF2897 family protein [Shewanella psychropiezotolerans]
MSDLETWLIIILVIGVIASNLAVLKYSAKFKMTQFGKDTKLNVRAKKPAGAKEKTTPTDQSSANATGKTDNADKAENTDTDDKSGS